MDKVNRYLMAKKEFEDKYAKNVRKSIDAGRDRPSITPGEAMFSVSVFLVTVFLIYLIFSIVI